MKWIVGIQAIALLFFVVLSTGLGLGWYISDQSWQDYVQPREEVFYDGVFYTCMLMGGTNQQCQTSTGKFYALESFERRYLLGSQDWEETQGKEIEEVY